jgi:hypothetical protein
MSPRSWVVVFLRAIGTWLEAEQCLFEELDERRAGAKLGGDEMRIEAQQGGAPQLISTYPSTWTAHYLKNQYERFDPVITQALEDTEPIQWGLNSRASILSRPQRELFEDAARFGIACGFTIPIHDGRGPIASVTFAADEHRGAAFSRRVEAPQTSASAHGDVFSVA